ncbi:unnamed protein product [Soboliphyme baturini]|uniref:MARVEL domain-containing protein n=1 Tax=Soboliphyme baturini TaxID=241478 RepID=A0A183JA74_9BILA|nr:unnamed protein product [Soboliphyme baturini]
MGEMELRFNYCYASVQGLLKWLQMVFSSIVLGLLLWETLKQSDYGHRYLLEGEEYTVFVAAFTLCVITLFLLIFFLTCHQGPLSGCHCSTVVSTLNAFI